MTVQRWLRFEHGDKSGFGSLDGSVVHEHQGNMFGRPEPTGRQWALVVPSLSLKCVP